LGQNIQVFEQQQMKIFMELDESKKKEKTVMYSTSLPKGLKESLSKAAAAIHRKKADWIRTALNQFLLQGEKAQEFQIIKSYQEMGITQLRPFTTTLFEGQLRQLNLLSKSLKRSKAEILRTAIFIFLSCEASKQESEIKNFLSR
jgi:predicted transcriptional regulator